MAYYKDKVGRTNHLRAARRAFRKASPGPESPQYAQATQEYERNVVLNRGKELILKERPGYATDDDVEAGDLMALTEKMRTKDVRGDAKKNDG